MQSSNIEILDGFIENYNCSKIMLVTGRNSFYSSGAFKLFKFDKKNVSVFRFYEFSENPKLEDLIKSINFFKKHSCDSIIAVGGGSVIDMAKLVSFYHEENLSDFDVNLLKKRKTPLMVIPTTAGSGSESTKFAVLYINGEKFSIQHESILPDEKIIDPNFSFSMSKNQKAISGLDAFSQSIESFWSQNSTPQSKLFSKEALKLIWENLYQSVNKNDFDAHAKVFHASILAGKAINIAKTTSCHALSYYFTSKHNISHGHAVALLLPKIYEYNLLKLQALNDSSLSEINDILGVDEKNVFNTLSSFIKSLDIEIDFSNLGINLYNESSSIISSVNKDRLKNNPVPIDLKKLINSIIN